MSNIVQVVVMHPTSRPKRTTLNVGDRLATLDETPNRSKAIIHNNGPSTIELTCGHMTLRVLRGNEWVSNLVENGPITARVVTDP